MNFETIFEYAFRIVRRTQRSYLTSNQEYILLKLNKKYDEEKYKSYYSINGKKIREIIEDERLQNLDEILEKAIFYATFFYFISSLVILCLISWLCISFFSLNNFGFPYAMLIIVVSIGLSYLGNVIFCQKEKNTIEIFSCYRNYMWQVKKETRQYDEYKAKKEQDQHDEELRKKYLE